ncbi:MAG TPA: DUF2207 domain-containing protein [Thermoanaerobaculia bacterium]|nr:DUF2207 domain-containing protein [Thermoanaerobaculia bacterium]
MRYKLFVVLLALGVSPAFAKSLSWRSLDVTANLDRDGRLHVVEKQAIVFDGDWNGGERVFRVGAGQSLQFESIARVDGGERPLSSGDLAQVDHYSFTSPTVLRWRSRLPDDPPFVNKEITYILRYTLNGVLRQTDGAYLLSHDFAFPDRSGVIQHFSLRLDIDPVWRGAQSPVVIQRENLVPGKSVVVPLTLQFSGAGAPAGAVRTLSRKAIYGVLVLFLFAVAFLLFDFVSHESAKGRFDRLVPPDAVDDAFLQQNVFAFTPELVGAAVDNKTAGPEVAAVLARMTQEGKLSSSVEQRGTLFKHKVLCLNLQKDADDLPSYEAKLVRALFFGAKNTDTDRIRKHYQSSGFNPALMIESGIAQELKQIKGWEKQPQRANWKQNWIFFSAALLLLILAGAFGSNNDAPVTIFVGVAGAILLGCAAAAANLNSSVVTNFIRFAIPAAFLAPLYWLVIGYTLGAVRLLLHLTTPIAICLWTVAITKLVLDALRTKEGPERIAFRKRLYAARNYFIHELHSPKPRLRDEWYPYFLAFGLGQYVDQWFGSYGAAGSQPAMASSFGSSTGSGGGLSSPSFTGGGGAFGGAGATGGWAIAAAAMAAGVSAPSSSSSGGSSSSSSSSSSSGGGGGGGW